jgi:peptide deformylase
MAVLPVRIYGEPVLRQPTAPLDSIDGAIHTLVQNMYATQVKQKGIGLSGPQVGLSRRLFTVDTTEFIKDGGPAVFINPEILGTDGEAVYEEGCLSFPGIYFDVRRPRTVGLRYLDLAGNEQVVEADGVLARIILHEFDHLEGRLFIDTLNEEGRIRIEGIMQQRGIIPARS